MSEKEPAKADHPTLRGTGILPVTGALPNPDASHLHGQDGRATEHSGRQECPSINPPVRSNREGLSNGE